MTHSNSKADFFSAMGLGPVWELRKPSLDQNTLLPAPELLEQVAPSDLPGLEALKITVANCRNCGLFETRTQTVFADGVPNAPLMVVGEAPGGDEDASGVPFVGKSGQLLDRMLQTVGASRTSNVYMANVLKCRPPGNRDPERQEIERCSPYLVQQILVNQPKVLLLVGKVAIQTLLNTKKPLAELRGEVQHVLLHGMSIPAVVTYHPAYLLRRPDQKAKAWEDLLLLKQQGVL